MAMKLAIRISRLNQKEKPCERVWPFQIRQRVGQKSFHRIGDYKSIVLVIKQCNEMPGISKTPQPHTGNGWQRNF